MITGNKGQEEECRAACSHPVACTCNQTSCPLPVTCRNPPGRSLNLNLHHTGSFCVTCLCDTISDKSSMLCLWENPFPFSARITEEQNHTLGHNVRVITASNPAPSAADRTLCESATVAPSTCL